MKDTIEKNKKITDRILSNQKPTSLDKMKKNRYNNIIKIINTWCDRNKPLLDIGARLGEMLDMFSEQGFINLHAVEVNNKGKKELKNKGYTIIQGDAENFVSKVGFGTVTISHTLEHCDFPYKVVNNVYDVLVVDGYFYVEVPAQSTAPLSLGHVSFFPKLSDLISIFDKSRWSLVDSGISNKKNVWVLFKKVN